MNEVEAMLGMPFHKSEPDQSEGALWLYSRQGKDKRASYYSRIVVFPHCGTVLSTERELMLD